jgi:hypothetical protein
MRRPHVLILAGFGAFCFVAVALLLARGLSGAGTERADVLAVLRAEAAGDSRAVLARLPACAKLPACVATVQRRVSTLARPGRVEILQYRPSVELALTDRTGVGRVAWRAGTGRPVVQCVRVERQGPLTGAGATLLSVGPPIGLEAACE